MGAVARFTNDFKASWRLAIVLIMIPPQRGPCGKMRRSKRVIMPKFVAPPFRARWRERLWVEFALVISPEASTTCVCKLAVDFLDGLG